LKIGLIAGYGGLPVIAAEKLLNDGHEVYIVALYEEVTADFSHLENIAVEKFSITQVGKVIKALVKNDVKNVLFAGKVNKTLLFSDLKFDLTAIKLLAAAKNRKDDTLMGIICDEMKSNGINVLKQSEVFSHLLIEKGVFSRKKPTEEQMQDVFFGLEIAKELGRIDTGQTVVVKNKAVMALEAIEGTDKAVERGCQLAKQDAVVVKCAKPSQDERFDIPTVGVDTLKNISNNNGRILAVEANSTFVVDKKACIDYADKHKLIFMAI